MNKKLKQLRINKGYSLTKLSKLSGISIKYLNNLENGIEQNPYLHEIQKIAIALDKDIIDICYAILQNA